MAITWKEAFHLVESGQAEPALTRFIHFVRHYSILARTGQIDADPDEVEQSASDLVVISALLIVLLKTPEGKRVLHKNYRGKSYDVLKKYAPPSPEFDIGMRLVNGVIDQDTALAQLKEQLDIGRDERPDRKTLKTILADIEGHCDQLLREFRRMTGTAGWDGHSLDDLPSRLEEVFADIGIKSTK